MRFGVLRLNSIGARLRAHLASQDGIALVVALGALLVLGVTGTTVVYYSSANTRSSSYSKASGTSFQLSEAGLHEALSVLSNQPTNDPTNPSLLATRISPYSTGSVTWGGTYDSANAKWTITSTGKVVNPASAAPSEATRTITAKVPIRPVTTQTLAVESWNYVFSYGTGSSCDMTTTSTVSVETRLLVSGNFCMTSRSTLDGTSTQLLVGGTVKLTGNDTRIGQAGTPIAEAHVAGGCQLNAEPVHSPCQGPPGNADRVWATTISTNPGLLVPPTPDWNGWYDRSSPGPTENCTGANRVGSPPVFDNDTAWNRSAPTANLTPASSYTCRTFLGAEPFGELSWDDATNKLTVRGTIFIDGDVQVTQAASYEGQATLYASGSFYIGGTNRMCAVMAGADCNFGSGIWDPNSRLLTIVTNGAGGGSVPADSTVLLASSAQWQGAIYGGPHKARVESSARFAGPLIADEVALSSSIQTEPFTIISTAPTGMPGNATIQARPDKLELFSG
jgi:Tfp pilus assembly protein PilX